MHSAVGRSADRPPDIFLLSTSSRGCWFCFGEAALSLSDFADGRPAQFINFWHNPLIPFSLRPLAFVNGLKKKRDLSLLLLLFFPCSSPEIGADMEYESPQRALCVSRPRVVGTSVVYVLSPCADFGLLCLQHRIFTLPLSSIHLRQVPSCLRSPPRSSPYYCHTAAHLILGEGTACTPVSSNEPMPGA